ncbi:MAG: DUF47 domain-containing protein, partial [Caldimicrobium sp.]
ACNISENIIFVAEGKVIKGEKLEEEPQYLKEPLEENLTFHLLKRHAQLIIECLSALPLALEAYLAKDKKCLKEIALNVNEIEKEADKLKTNIRNHLPKGIILPVEIFKLYLYLKEQDSLANLAEKLLQILTLYQIKNLSIFEKELTNLLNQTLTPLSYLGELVENTFRYLTTWDELSREKAKSLIREVRHSQYLTEKLAFEIKETLYASSLEIMDFLHLLQIIDLIAKISSHMENVADLLRAMLAK